MKRGQASMEYLMTYGWAFLVILVAIGALAYFGILNPSKWVPDKCDFGSQLECVDYALGDEFNPIQLFVRNNFGKDIDILKIHYKGADFELELDFDCSSNPCTIPAGETEQIDIISDKLSEILIEGEKQQVTLKVTFERTGSGNPHTLMGIVYATVQ